MEVGNSYYWMITTRDGTTVAIPPSGVDIVKRRWDEGKPIHTTNRVIPANQIKSFEKTSRTIKPNQLLIEGAAQAFREPLINKDDSIQARWVKKAVTPQEWERYYSPSLYKRLPDEEGMVMVAFRVATHDIDTDKVSYCSPDEISKLDS